MIFPPGLDNQHVVSRGAVRSVASSYVSNAYGGWFRHRFVPRARHSMRMTYRPYLTISYIYSEFFRHSLSEVIYSQIESILFPITWA